MDWRLDKGFGLGFSLGSSGYINPAWVWIWNLLPNSSLPFFELFPSFCSTFGEKKTWLQHISVLASHSRTPLLKFFWNFVLALTIARTDTWVRSQMSFVVMIVILHTMLHLGMAKIGSVNSVATPSSQWTIGCPPSTVTSSRWHFQYT